MELSREVKKAEAVARMKMLGIFPETIRQFEEEDLVSISEPPFGAFFWAEGKVLDGIRKFEESNNAVVYMVVRSHTSIGLMDSLLFVSDYQEEWEDDRADITEDDRGMLAYVYNYDMPECSEMGYIVVERTPAAGLVRTW